ncbi:hypothetical protein [Pajaroellobacter abortibovis]|uniref:TonB C-terminal domain-containing protein n=1 Tax=Pajaroellobacter abortibovis TaxID=1882918 RepID=A0A1L6MWY4_9BACT|nr:hypothetical protein [Pajaroellobacter abortibovis]APS00032.1 hypothetical protein BCY86_04545 [Pajaroellobacter abortibovis]
MMDPLIEQTLERQKAIKVGISVTLGIHALPLVGWQVLHLMHVPLSPVPDYVSSSKPSIAAALVHMEREQASPLKGEQPVPQTELPPVSPSNSVLPPEEMASIQAQDNLNKEPSIHKIPEKIMDAGAVNPRVLASPKSTSKPAPSSLPSSSVASSEKGVTSDLTKLIAHSSLFAEEQMKGQWQGDVDRMGIAQGGKGGGDPNAKKQGDEYSARLSQFFHERWQYPMLISQEQANHLCVIYRITVNQKMQISRVESAPIRKSGHELFDDSALSMLMKLLEGRVALPEPPSSIENLYKGRVIQIVLSGNLQGDTSSCK